MAEDREMDYPTIETVNGETLINGMPQEEPLNGTFVREEGAGVRSIMHFRNDQLHNENGPALEVLGNDGKTMEANYYRNGLLHRDGDLPAIEYFYGSSDGKPTREEYFKNGERHRDGGQPAVMGMNGDLEWYQNGKLHHEGGPSRITYMDPEHPEGVTQYHIHGREVESPEIDQLPLLEMTNGLPHVNGEQVLQNELNGAYRKPDGFIEHYKDGKLHSDSGPAMEHPDGTKIYYREGQIHRGNDLPAVEYAGGEKEYFRHGKQVPPPETEKAHAGGKEQTGENRLEYKNGQYHINDRPVEDRNAINGRFVREGGDIEQYKNGKLHSEGERPSVEKQDGTKMWHKDGELQKVERSNGEKLNFENGKMLPSPETEKSHAATVKEQAGEPFEFGPQMKAGDLPIDSKNLLKDMVNAHEGKRSPEMQRKHDGADMRQMTDARNGIEHSQLMERAEATLKESGKTDGKVVHKDELTGKTVEYNLKNGELHTNGKDPSFVIRDKHGQIERAEYHQNGNVTKTWDRETGQMFYHAPEKAQEKEMQKPQHEKNKPENTPEKSNTENKGSQVQSQSKETKDREETREEKLDRLKAAREEHQKQEKTHDRGERR